MDFGTVFIVLFLESPFSLRQDASRCQWVTGLLFQVACLHFHRTLSTWSWSHHRPALSSWPGHLTSPRLAQHSHPQNEDKSFRAVSETGGSMYQVQNRHSINAIIITRKFSQLRNILMMRISKGERSWLGEESFRFLQIQHLPHLYPECRYF